MKKLVLTTVCALAVTGAAFAQGSANWSTISFSFMTAQTNTSVSPLFGGSGLGGTAGAAGSATGGFYYELLWSAYTGVQAAKPATLTALNTWADTGLAATNQTTAGRLSPIGATAVNNASLPWDTGSTNNIMVVGWSANLGTTWAAASANLNSTAALNGIVGNIFFGESNTGFINPLANGTAPGAGLFGGAAGARGLPISSLNTPLFLVQVPEPTTIALAGLGGLSVLLFRRRKS
jgi:hypothetical protein